jgi:hypothetical protein
MERLSKALMHAVIFRSFDGDQQRFAVADLPSF